jgi:23S rRNA (cytosine1962-C5)-methyltransferase
MPYPVVRILEGHDRRLRGGSPWLFSNELQMDRAAKELGQGTIVRLAAHDGKAMALAFFNPHSLIAARILTRSTEATIDRSFIERRLRRALSLRERLYDEPYYRLVNAEADGLPGLIVDRFGAVLVVQVGSAGFELLGEALEEAMIGVTGATSIIYRNDTLGRELEGLPREGRTSGAPPPRPLELRENALTYLADVVEGQKTGWYYDQRQNRKFTAALAGGRTVLDLYSYTGGFGLAALAAGCRSAHLVDRSESALELARATAGRMDAADKVTCTAGEVFEIANDLSQGRQRFDIVVADPPPFARSRKDLPVALKAYQKLARIAAGLVEESGILCLACCSHNVPEDEFLKVSYAGIRMAGRSGPVIRRAGAGPDHPIHPALAESAYLKFLAFALD